MTRVVLPESATGNSAAVAFAGFPGTYTPGVPCEIALSETDAKAALEELGLPLEIVGAKPARRARVVASDKPSSEGDE